MQTPDPIFLETIEVLVNKRAAEQRRYLEFVERIDRAIDTLRDIAGVQIPQESMNQYPPVMPSPVVAANVAAFNDWKPTTNPAITPSKPEPEVGQAPAAAAPAKPVAPAPDPNPAAASVAAPKSEPVDKPPVVPEKPRSAKSWVHDVAMGMPGNFAGAGVHRYIQQHGPKLELAYVQMLLRGMAAEGLLRVVERGRPGRESVFCVATRPAEMPKEIPGATPQYGRREQK